MTYEHVQKQPSEALAIVGAGLLALSLTPPGLLLRIATMGISSAATLMMSSLTVRIKEGILTATFGGGVYSKRVELRQVEYAEQIKTSFLQGWGIRWVGDGWLYNIYGTSAVQLNMKTGGRVCVGTDEPQKLCDIINEEIEQLDRSR